MHDQEEIARPMLVYGVGLTGELVFLPRARAEVLAELYAALNGATTWGELRNRLPPMLYGEIVARLDQDEENGAVPPADDAPFEADMIPGFADGDWPDFPAQDMLAWLPADLQGRYGKIVDTTLNGPYLSLDPRMTDALVAELTARGYRCDSDEALVRQAQGG